MSAAARGAAGITLRRLLEGRKEVSEDLMLALYRAQSELEFIARGYTRQELADALGLGINVICGRVNELMKSPFGLVEELEKRDCRITGETASPLRASTEATRALRLEQKEAA